MFDKRIFKNHLNEFFIDVMDICKNNSDDLLTFDDYLPVFFASGKYKKFVMQKSIDYEFLILRIINKKIEELSSYSLLSKFFVTKEFQNYDKKLQGTIYEHLSTKPHFSKKLPLKFIVSYLNKNKGFDNNKKVFDSTFEKFYLFLTNLLNDTYVVPLFNFESNIKNKEIKINDVEIRPITENEFYYFTNLNENQNLSNIFYNLTHVMYTTYSSNDLNSGYDVVKSRFELILDSLCLTGSGNPIFGTIFRNINNSWIHYDSKYETDVIKQESLFFDTKNLSKLKSIFSSLSDVDFNKKENAFLDISKRRFSSALTRSNPIDQLIDLTVSLESLFAPTPGEITVRLSNRMATLLAKNDSQREDYWIFVKKVYNLRSGIVHGDGLRNTEINGKKFTLDEILEKLIDLTRKAILIYIKLVRNYSGNNKIHKICDDIDRALINKSFLKEFQTRIN
jgi:hypothetical protein